MLYHDARAVARLSCITRFADQRFANYETDEASVGPGRALPTTGRWLLVHDDGERELLAEPPAFVSDCEIALRVLPDEA